MPTMDIIEILGYDIFPDFSTFTIIKGCLIVVYPSIDKTLWYFDDIKKLLHIETKDLIGLTANESITLTWKNAA